VVRSIHLIHANERMVANRVSLVTKYALAKLLGKRDDDALGPADVG
jgi:hypothetical protein